MKRYFRSPFIMILLFPMLPLPHFTAQLSEDVLSKDKEGCYITGPLLVHFASIDGFDCGLRAALYNSGGKDD